ncbi:MULTISPECIES: carbohydrate ABC transporter permease [Streptococcus]|jgi:carbohydrate ABC superfamily ATP binding cassette transporter, membrane protein|uniref:L-arabinose transport system permease protein AraQ n=2 Tax=Streptococcus intermedius TaxID=1338 RepID=A0AAE8G2J9_STRIT|nr:MULTISPECIES: carbohydrate ABC transporter permease [Streptococcus]RKW10864.1 MAG: carbohydrate ABC transporter permease [Catonella sp.]AGU76426.1 putative transporter protein [Streptococcus intermedius B196]AGU78261.1 putative transporter protein [Streptococcus intermedius C270]ALF27875.1 sugar ABC transporter permease [Streptococcus intermedius]ARC26109.1 carbohydrate ABC transporter permease [Streptococcus intermedius]
MKSKKIQKEKIDYVGIHSFDKKTDFFFNVLIAIFALSCVLPFFFVIIISLTDETSLVQNGFAFWPSKFSLAGYEFLLSLKDKLLQSLFITIFITIVGTTLNVFFTTTYAYAISRRTFKYRRFFTLFAMASMLFQAGLIPTYIIMTTFLGLGDTVWALILPLLLSPFNIILMRTFFKRTISESIIESAKIDGASETRIFFQICLPLSLPGIATITLFTALAYWNDWFNALLYIRSDNLVPLQYLLIKIQQNLDYLSKSVGASAQLAGLTNSFPKESARMAMVVLATVPIACVYPFFQRYFVKGLTIGGVKE